MGQYNKPSLSGFLRDEIARREMIEGGKNALLRGAFGAFGAPVDLITMAARPFGYNVPDAKVVGSSEWLGKKAENIGMLNGGNRNAFAEGLAGILTPEPMDALKIGSAIFPVAGKALTKIKHDPDDIVLYHGSHAKDIKEIDPNYGIGNDVDFGGIFASANRIAAESHGDHLYRVSGIKEHNIMNTHDVMHDFYSYKKAREAIEDIFRRKGSELTDEDLDNLDEIILNEKLVSDFDGDYIAELLGKNKEDYGYAGWEAQRLRGEVAKRLGYKAVEMTDEHGTSYLVLPGNKIHHDYLFED